MSQPSSPSSSSRPVLIKGATVISMDPAIGDLASGDILFQRERILAVGPNLAHPEAEIVDAAGCIVIPGLVQAHVHLWHSGLRGVGADWAGSGGYQFFHATIGPNYRPADSYIATLFGALSQIDAGTTTVFDWCHNNSTPEHTDASVEGLSEAGIRAVFGHGTVKPKPKPGEPHFSTIPHPMAEIARLRKGRFASKDQLLTLAMCILGPDYSSLDVCRHDFRAANDLDLLSSAHVWGRANRLVEGGYLTLAREGLLGPNHNVAHGNYMEDDELQVLIDQGASITATAGVELAHHAREPLCGRVARLGGLPSIGVDSESSNSGAMFDVMRTALRAQRFINNQILAAEIASNQDSEQARYSRENLKTIGTGGSLLEHVTIKTREALQWATMNNAKALRLDHKIGSLTPGKQADLLVLRRDSMNMLGVHDPVQAVVFYAQTTDVDSVYIAGRAHKRGGVLLHADLAARKQALMASARKLFGGEIPAFV